MCVIAICAGHRLLPEMAELMWKTNSFGGGVAWREGPEDRRVVRYLKGIDTVEEMMQLAADLPLPYIAHFRIPSVGGDWKHLNHPFEIDPLSPLKLEGESSTGVLFHNGTWHDWRHQLKTAAIAGGWKLPDGRYSDSRAMAIMAAHMGSGILELIEEKIAVLTPTRLDSFGGFTVRENIWVSNTFWEPIQGRGHQQVHGAAADRPAAQPAARDIASMYLTPPASMAGGRVIDRAADTTIAVSPAAPGGAADLVVPFVPASRKDLRRLRRRQEKEATAANIVHPMNLNQL